MIVLIGVSGKYEVGGQFLHAPLVDQFLTNYIL